jgi:putative addiction module killer protein
MEALKMIEIEFFQEDNGKEPFTVWFENLKDAMARIKIRQRLDRMTKGNFGDVEPVGTGVLEIKIHHGPGYRIYFANLSSNKILILYGGAKGTQKKDIKKSQEFYKNYRLE